MMAEKGNPDVGFHLANNVHFSDVSFHVADLLLLRRWVSRRDHFCDVLLHVADHSYEDSGGTSC